MSIAYDLINAACNTLVEWSSADTRDTPASGARGTRGSLLLQMAKLLLHFELCTLAGRRRSGQQVSNQARADDFPIRAEEQRAQRF